jgi:hypothetical protein
VAGEAQHRHRHHHQERQHEHRDRCALSQVRSQDAALEASVDSTCVAFAGRRR